MKKLLLATALAALLGSPAFAQSFNSSYGSGNIAPNVTASNPDGIFRYAPSDQSSNGAYAQAVTGSARRHHRSNVQLGPRQ